MIFLTPRFFSSSQPHLKIWEIPVFPPNGCRIWKRHRVGDFHLLRLGGRAVFLAALRAPAELALGIFSALHNRCWSTENPPGLAKVSLLETNRRYLLVGRRFVLCFCLSRCPAVVLPTLCSLLCLLGISPPATRYFPLVQAFLRGWINVLFQSFTPTCDEHNACLIGAFSPLFWRGTCVHADSRTTAFWIAYEPCGRECAERRPFLPQSGFKITL